MRIIKVLNVIPGYGGGISSYVKNLIEGMIDSSIRIDVVGFSEYPDEYKSIVKQKGGKTYTLISAHKNFWKFQKEYRSILKANKYDVLHCHISGYKGFVFKLYAHIYHIPRIITHAHRTSDENTQGVRHKISVKISKLLSSWFSTDYFTCSQMAAEFIFGKKLAHSGRIISMPNSVNFDRFAYSMSLSQKRLYFKQLSISIDNLVIGHIGRFNIQKNHEFMVNIARKLKEQDIKFTMFFIGEGELKGKIKEEITTLHLENNVLFLGFRSDVPEMLHLFDVMILPSLFEGLPTVAVESQAAGVPTLLSDAITPEVDMRIDLVKYLPLQNADIWVDEIVHCKNVKLVSKDKRKIAFIKRGFTLDGLCERYSKYINNGVNK